MQIHKILDSIDRGNLTLEQIAKDLNIGKRELINPLASLNTKELILEALFKDFQYFNLSVKGQNYLNNFRMNRATYA